MEFAQLFTSEDEILTDVHRKSEFNTCHEKARQRNFSDGLLKFRNL
jgi:hypothetical protein